MTFVWVIVTVYAISCAALIAALLIIAWARTRWSDAYSEGFDAGRSYAKRQQHLSVVPERRRHGA